ncbi:MAG: hypothetical protein RID53_31420 [Coleofasciculus sp. B1-GNL1-01]|uniref:hypothetical protein n=1 Tax=Coleofasciculus sp. B1-GNL1-01 TaxID=3068484 RepID=UPI0032F38AF7
MSVRSRCAWCYYVIAPFGVIVSSVDDLLLCDRVSPTQQGFLQIIQQASGEADYTYRSLGYASSCQLFN